MRGEEGSVHVIIVVVVVVVVVVGDGFRKAMGGTEEVQQGSREDFD
jgi:hypothetical protein